MFFSETQTRIHNYYRARTQAIITHAGTIVKDYKLYFQEMPNPILYMFLCFKLCFPHGLLRIVAFL